MPVAFNFVASLSSSSSWLSSSLPKNDTPNGRHDHDTHNDREDSSSSFCLENDGGQQTCPICCLPVWGQASPFFGVDHNHQRNHQKKKKKDNVSERCRMAAYAPCGHVLHLACAQAWQRHCEQQQQQSSRRQRHRQAQPTATTITKCPVCQTTVYDLIPLFLEAPPLLEQKEKNTNHEISTTTSSSSSSSSTEQRPQTPPPQALWTRDNQAVQYQRFQPWQSAPPQSQPQPQEEFLRGSLPPRRQVQRRQGPFFLGMGLAVLLVATLVWTGLPPTILYPLKQPPQQPQQPQPPQDRPHDSALSSFFFVWHSRRMQGDTKWGRSDRSGSSSSFPNPQKNKNNNNKKKNNNKRVMPRSSLDAAWSFFGFSWGAPPESQSPDSTTVVSSTIATPPPLQWWVPILQGCTRVLSRGWWGLIQGLQTLSVLVLIQPLYYLLRFLGGSCDDTS